MYVRAVYFSILYILYFHTLFFLVQRHAVRTLALRLSEKREDQTLLCPARILAAAYLGLA